MSVNNKFSPSGPCSLTISVLLLIDSDSIRSHINLIPQVINHRRYSVRNIQIPVGYGLCTFKPNKPVRLNLNQMVWS